MEMQRIENQNKQPLRITTNKVHIFFYLFAVRRTAYILQISVSLLSP